MNLNTITTKFVPVPVMCFLKGLRPFGNKRTISSVSTGFLIGENPVEIQSLFLLLKEGCAQVHMKQQQQIVQLVPVIGTKGQKCTSFRVSEMVEPFTLYTAESCNN